MAAYKSAYEHPPHNQLQLPRLSRRVTSSEATHAPASHRIVTIAGEQEGVLKVSPALVREA